MSWQSRREERRPFSCNGWIKISNAADLIVCRIEDISKGGAKLLIFNSEPIPDRFTLRFSAAAPNGRVCQVRWRRGNAIGIMFMTRSDGVRD
jgi:hypothetical protein